MKRAAYLLAPLLVLAAVALGVVPLMSFAIERGGAFTFDSYAWRVARFTLFQAAVSTLVSILIAIPAARALARQEFPGRRILLAIFAVPLSLPAIVAVFGLAAVYGSNGPLGGGFTLYGLNGIVLAHVFFNLPLAARLLLEALSSAPAENHRLAAQLDFSDWTLFRHVDWPVLRSALPHVAALIFLLCAASFVIVLIFGGPAATTLEVAIWQSLRMDFDVSRALTLSFMQVALSTLLVLAASRALKAGPTLQGIRLERTRFDGRTPMQRVVDAAILLIAAVIVVPPLVAITWQGLLNISATALTGRAILTSLGIATLSAAIALPLAWGLGLAQARLPAWRGALNAVGLAAMLVPPAVIATGWFLMFRNVGGGLGLTLLLVAVMNSLMALPFLLAALAPGLANAAASHDRLCDELGISGFNRFRLVDAPALRGPLAQAALMAFVLSLGDLTAVTLLGAQGLVTLPVLVQQQMGHYQSAAAGGTALLLAALCGGLTLASQRAARWT